MKAVNSVDAPSTANSLHSKKSLRGEDFALELAKESDSQYEVHHEPHTSDLWSGRESAHVTVPSQKAVTTPPAIPMSMLVMSNVMKGVPTDHPMPPQTSAMTTPKAVAPEALPIMPVVEKPGPLPTIPTIPVAMPPESGLPLPVPHTADMNSSHEIVNASADAAQAASAVERQEDDSQTWFSTQQQLNVMVTPTGVTEDLLGSRVFGVHLLASTYLSELETREEESITADSTPGALAPIEAHMSGDAQPITTDATSFPSDAATEQASKGEAEIILRVIMNEEMAPVADNSHPTRATAIATSAAATLAWSESLLRLTKASDGSTVVWLRDYRVDGKEASRLVNALVEGAQAQGARLGRIVLNGREVWTSPNSR